MNRVLLSELETLGKTLGLDVTTLTHASTPDELLGGLAVALDLAVSSNEAWGLMQVDYTARYVKRALQLTMMVSLSAGETGLYAFARDSLLFDLARCAILRSYESQNEAQAVQQAVFVAITQHGSSPVLYRQWQALLRESLEQQKNTLPHIEYHRVTHLKPALVLAYELYDDISYEADIMRRNRVKHPGFILPGTLLEVLSREN